MRSLYPIVFVVSVMFCVSAKANEKELDISTIQKLEALAVNGDIKARDVLIGYYIKDGTSHYAPKKATSLLEEIAENNNSDAMVYLGKLYLYGTNGIEKDAEAALRWFDRAGDLGNVEGSILEADIYFNDKRYSLAFNNYLSIARNIHEPQPRIQWLVSSMLTQGLGVAKDLETAHLYASHSAANGYAEAQKDLGINYYKGLGVKRSKRLAKLWLKKAADQDHKIAHSYLGAIYMDNKKFKKGIHHYGRAIELGHSLSCKLLADARPKVKRFQPEIDEAMKTCK